MPDNWDYSQPRGRGPDAVAQAPIITFILCLFSAIATLAFFTSDKMPTGSLWYQIGHFGVLPSESIWDGHLGGMLTSMFVHLSFFHILFNMMWLSQIGRIVEAEINPLWYSLFILSAAIVGSGSELALTGQTGAGASGVVYALFGLVWSSRWERPIFQSVATRQNLNLFLAWGVICVFLTYTGMMQIANGAHWGGLAFGLCVGHIFLARRKRLKAGLGLAALVLVTLLSVTWMPWSRSWTYWKGGKAMTAQKWDAAKYWFRRSLALGEDPEYVLRNIVNIEEYLGHSEAAAAATRELEAATRQHTPTNTLTP